ncbi:hypothetical protein V499_09668 [Pseudogymnoascus sp. VKM F-103]|nr:hypothetical protein V499_09668 [Pseudogymnoascus sp. VKM F-103]
MRKQYVGPEPNVSMTKDSWVLGQLDSCPMDTSKRTVVAVMFHGHTDMGNQFGCAVDDSSQSPIIRFLTPLGWAVRFPDGHIVYENRMGRQGPPRGGYPSPRQFPGRHPRQPQGQYPGQSMGGFPGQSQGQYPGQSMGGFPGQPQGQSMGGLPGQPQGQFPGQFFGRSPSQSSTQSSSHFPGMVITQSSGQMPGVTIIQPPGTGQSPVFISPYPGQVLGQNPGSQPTQQPGGGWSASPGPKLRQRFRTGPERVRVAELKEDEIDCPICYRDYYTGDSENESEDAVRIGCGHVYGRRCLDKWIQENGTCPTCRGKLDLVDDVAGNPQV